MKKVNGIDTLEGTELFWDDKDTGTFGYYKDDNKRTGPVGDWIYSHKRIIEALPSKRTCIQAGGAMGLYPLLLANLFDVVHTFEAYKPSYDIMKMNILEHGVDNIKAFNYAIGDTAKMVDIHVDSPSNLGMNRIVEKKRDGEICMITVDSIVTMNVDLIWFDIEGYEADALAGSMETIKKNMPVIGLETPNDECRDLLKCLGYVKEEKSVSDTFFYPPT